jgi:hypothetical protein
MASRPAALPNDSAAAYITADLLAGKNRSAMTTRLLVMMNTPPIAYRTRKPMIDRSLQASATPGRWDAWA